jgi:hypothetical protein
VIWSRHSQPKPLSDGRRERAPAGRHRGAVRRAACGEGREAPTTPPPSAPTNELPPRCPHSFGLFYSRARPGWSLSGKGFFVGRYLLGRKRPHFRATAHVPRPFSTVLPSFSPPSLLPPVPPRPAPSFPVEGTQAMELWRRSCGTWSITPLPPPNSCRGIRIKGRILPSAAPEPDAPIPNCRRPPPQGICSHAVHTSWRARCHWVSVI